jgi:hypothetical protein
MPVKNKLSRILSKVLLLRDQAAPTINTTLAADAVAGDDTITLTDGTGLANGQILRIGDGEEYEPVVVGSFVGAVVTLADASGLVYDHAAGQAAVSQNAYDLGDPTDKGVTITVNGESVDVNVATRRLVFTIIRGYTDLQGDIEFPALTLYNLAVATGTDFAKVVGAGTPADPLTLTMDGNDFGGATNQSLIVVSTLMDGTTLLEQLWGVDADYTGISLKLGRGALASLPVKFMASSGYIVSTGANPYALTTTFRPSKGKVWDRLTEFGVYVDATGTPGDTTVDAAAAAGAKVLPVADTTNFAPDDVVKVGSEDTAEFHVVDTVQAGVSLTLLTPLFRDQAVGVTVKEQTPTPIASVAEDGVTVGFSGSMTKIRTATRRLALLNRPNQAGITVSLGIMELTLAGIAQALGLPSSAISGTRMDAATLLGTVSLDGVYMKGFLQDGTAVQVEAWGCSQDLSGLARTMGAGAPAVIPFKLRPSSALRLQQAA